MASVFKVAFEFSVKTALGRCLQLLGDRFNPVTITPTSGIVFDTTDTVTDNFGIETLWQTGWGGIDTFEYLFFLSDLDVYLELANTDTDPDERVILFVRGGIPLMIPGGLMGGFTSDTSRLDASILVSGTDYDNVTWIKVQRNVEEGVGDATVRLILVG